MITGGGGGKRKSPLEVITVCLDSMRKPALPWICSSSPSPPHSLPLPGPTSQIHTLSPKLQISNLGGRTLFLMVVILLKLSSHCPTTIQLFPVKPNNFYLYDANRSVSIEENKTALLDAAERFREQCHIFSVCQNNIINNVWNDW